MGMDVRDVGNLARNADKAVRESLLKNRVDQNKQDSETLDNIDNKNKETKTTEVNKAKNNIEASIKPQNTDILRDPEADRMRKFLLFNDPSKT